MTRDEAIREVYELRHEWRQNCAEIKNFVPQTYAGIDYRHKLETIMAVVFAYKTDMLLDLVDGEPEQEL